MRLRRYRPMAVLLLALQLQACHYWEPTFVRPPRVIAEEEPSQVRITRTDGEQVTLQSPWVRADSIVGQDRSEAVWADRSVAVSDIRGMEIRRFSPGKTVGLLFLGVALGFLIDAAANFEAPGFFGTDVGHNMQEVQRLI